MKFETFLISVDIDQLMYDKKKIYQKYILRGKNDLIAVKDHHYELVMYFNDMINHKIKIIEENIKWYSNITSQQLPYPDNIDPNKHILKFTHNNQKHSLYYIVFTINKKDSCYQKLGFFFNEEDRDFMNDLNNECESCFFSCKMIQNALE